MQPNILWPGVMPTDATWVKKNKGAGEENVTKQEGKKGKERDHMNKLIAVC